jgi:hypothetical protein
MVLSFSHASFLAAKNAGAVLNKFVEVTLFPVFSFLVFIVKISSPSL